MRLCDRSLCFLCSSLSCKSLSKEPFFFVLKYNREVAGSNPVEVMNFFQTSLCNCINCVHCDDHFFISFHFISVVHIWFISYIINTEIVFVFIKQPNYIQVAENCNLWRSWWDMDVSTMLLVFSLQSHFTTSCFAAGCLCINLFLKRPSSYSEISWCSEMTRQINTLEKN